MDRRKEPRKGKVTSRVLPPDDPIFRGGTRTFVPASRPRPPKPTFLQDALVTRRRKFPPTGDPGLDQLQEELVGAVRKQFGLEATILEFPDKGKKTPGK